MMLCFDAMNKVTTDITTIDAFAFVIYAYVAHMSLFSTDIIDAFADASFALRFRLRCLFHFAVRCAHMLRHARCRHAHAYV